MTSLRGVDVFRKELLELLEECFAKTHGFFVDCGTSLFDIHDAVSAQQASMAVSPTGATIASHVDHVRFYLEVLTGDIEGSPGGRSTGTRAGE
ncbi:MAG: hypothetical protein JSW65_05600 [Candidatus Bipolaricaulota bacterium]|nr:MAG: hypothetical protein JSW65_05600 [Candidatus Bipolaricaulota bacterium]